MLRGLFKGEQSKDFVLLAYLTGILPVKKYKSESALNNFREFTMVSPKQLSKYIGFTEQEVKELCNTYFKSRDDVLTVLIHLGYLAYDVDSGKAYVPNEEVRIAFERAVKGTDWLPVIQAIKDSNELIQISLQC